MRHPRCCKMERPSPPALPSVISNLYKYWSMVNLKVGKVKHKGILETNTLINVNKSMVKTSR